MKIYSMTATFGKLNHQTLRLSPGLHVISAPNEWGKSTWCAFLLAMLYGLDTRAKSTKTALAPKEQYAPWSGEPMSGRMDICWQGRDITLERSTTGRVPMGSFRAYETATGVELPELTGENCGKKLLGVEREVFCRAGFIRQEEMPVTQSPELHARLISLVTTGEDTGDAQRLADGLKELKNKCKYNSRGLLPQVQQQILHLQDALEELDTLQTQCIQLEDSIEEGKRRQSALENHLKALENQQARQDARQVEQAEQNARRLHQEQEQWQEFCDNLPSRQEARQRLDELGSYTTAWIRLGQAQTDLPPEPERPQALPAFRGLSGREALSKAEADAAAYRDSVGRTALMLLLFGMVAVLSGVILALPGKMPIPGMALAGIGLVLLSFSLLHSGRGKGKLEALGKDYGTQDWKTWPDLADQYGDMLAAYSLVYEDWQHKKNAITARQESLNRQREELCQGREPEEMESLCRQVLDSWDKLDALRAQAVQARDHWQALAAMARRENLAGQDDLTLTREETREAGKSLEEELARWQHTLGACRGRMETLETREELERALASARARENALNRWLDALNLAQQTLTQATQELQRKFAPQISHLAQSYLEELTGGKYDRLYLTQELSLMAGARGEDTLRKATWRSSGTMDLLYLSLRLAIAKILAPEAPLVLDDALMRLDDERLDAAMTLLHRLGAEKQILLFSCQSREESWEKTEGSSEKAVVD